MARKNGCALAWAATSTAVLLAVPALSAASASQKQMDAMNRMEAAIKAAPMTGNPDHDFAAMMVPHHQGAIDMARLEVKYGKDPMLKEMARKTIESQTKEQKKLKDWLGKHPAKGTK